MTILTVTHVEDSWTAKAVHEALLREGAEVLSYEVDRIPAKFRMSVGNDSSGCVSHIEIDGRIVHADEITAVWHRRRNNAAPVTSVDLPDDMIEGILRESAASFDTAISLLPCFHLDDPAAVERARNRPFQLTVAAELGIDVPRTLTTNNPVEAREFIKSCDGRVVAKMLSSFGVRGEDNREKVVMTNRIEAEHLNQIESLSICPMTFQEDIPKALELRITVVGYEVFCAAVDSGLLAHGQTDWRRAHDELYRHWQPYDLPKQLRDNILRLLDRLQMNYGAIDVILTPEGRYVFLEVNPVGQFGWVQTSTHMPISNAIAGVLSGRLPRRVDIFPANFRTFSGVGSAALIGANQEVSDVG